MNILQLLLKGPDRRWRIVRFIISVLRNYKLFTKRPRNLIISCGRSFNVITSCGVTMKVNLHPAQLQNVITKVLPLAKYVEYDIDDYNCTDWALEVINTTVKPVEILSIPRHDIPGGHAYRGSATPQGLYLKLREMMKVGGTLNSNISTAFGGMGWRE